MFRIYKILFLYSNIFLNSFNKNVFCFELNQINDEKSETPFSYENIILLLRSLSSLYSGLEFFDQFKDDIDIDGLLGVRILSDQLNVTLQVLNRYENQKNWNQIIANTIEDLKEQSDQLLDTALPHIISNDRYYFNEVGGILESGLWSHIPDSSLLVKNSEEYESVLDLNEILVNENVSDYCVSQMLKSCQFSDFCWSSMTSFRYKDYPLSHQVFYLEMAKMKCPQIEWIWKRVHKLLTIFCSNMYFANKEIEENSYPTQDFDLFMENIAFCGVIGFKEFTENKNWLKQIVSQQNSFGCYMKELPTPPSPPQKRREKILKNGCSSHKTSMALASTVVYIRDIILELIFGVKDMIERNDNKEY